MKVNEMVIQLEEANEKLKKVNDLINNFDSKNINHHFKHLKTGLDLGTSSIVLTVVDENNQPIYAASKEANVVRDGLVVNYIEAVKITKMLKEKAEKALGVRLTEASGAIPPGTIGNNRNVVGNVIEAADMNLGSIFDEPTAAAKVLNVSNGIVVDVGGGTTGVSFIKDGQVVFSGDEPSGGTHITLVLAGYLGIDFKEAEMIKRQRNREKENFEIVRPVLEKIATITKNFLDSCQYNDSIPVYLVGGAVSFAQSESVFEKILNLPVVKPNFPRLVTPLGIAMSSEIKDREY